MADFLAGAGIFLVAFLLAALDPHPARPQPAAAGATQADPAPAEMHSGSLLLGAGGDRTLSEAARHLETEAEIIVTGSVARAVVTQTFRNTGEKRMEGVYAFPLPGDAAVDALRMQTGDRTVVGEIRSREKARKLAGPFRKAAGNAASGAPARDAAAVFTSAVPAVAPGGTITVRIAYQQTLEAEDGVHSLRFPLAAAPRPAPELLAYGVRHSGGTGTSGLTPSARNEGGRVPRPRLNPERHDTRAPVSLQVRLDPGFPLGAIESPGHAVSVERRGGDAALITLDASTVSGKKDFELTWKPAETTEPAARLFREDGDKAAYLLATIAPPTRESALPEQPREVVFLLDRSGSMAGGAFRQARDSLQAAVSRLDPGDRFNIIAFDRGHEALFETPVAANGTNRAIARDFIAGLVAGGGTRVPPSLSRALDDTRPDDTTRVRQVVLITDAAVDTPRQLFSEIAVKRGRSRLFAISIGPASDGRLLRRAAEIGRGDSLHIDLRQRIGERMDAFLERLDKPALTDLEIVWPKGAKARTAPEPLPDLYAGETLAISARAETPKGRITISGKFGGKPWSAEFDLAEAETAPGVAGLWGRRRIASLEAQRLHTRRDGAGVDADIEKVALRHGLVSRMTRLVAVETPPPEGRETASGTSPRRAFDTLRETVSLGRDDRSRQEAPAPSRDASVTAVLTPPSRAPVSLQEKGETAYRTAYGIAAQAEQADPDTGAENAPAAAQETGTDAGSEAQAAPGAAAFFSGRVAAIGIMALVFAAMSTLTLGLWRHLGRLYVSPGRGGRRR